MSVHQIKPEPWGRYKAKCAYFGPKLASLADFFKEIADGKRDRDPAAIIDGVDCQLESIRNELNDSLEEVSRYSNANADEL